MAENDSVDIWTAFAIGAMIGVGATLLLRSDPPSTSDRIVKRIRPIARKAQKAALRAGKHYGAAASELSGAGKEVIDDLQDEIEEVIARARKELGKSARRGLKGARRSITSRFG